jgi:hypothetical protein
MVLSIARFALRHGLALGIHVCATGRSPGKEKTMRIATFATMAGLAMFGTILCAQSVTCDFDRSSRTIPRLSDDVWSG